MTRFYSHNSQLLLLPRKPQLRGRLNGKVNASNTKVFFVSWSFFVLGAQYPQESHMNTLRGAGIEPYYSRIKIKSSCCFTWKASLSQWHVFRTIRGLSQAVGTVRRATNLNFGIRIQWKRKRKLTQNVESNPGHQGPSRMHYPLSHHLSPFPPTLCALLSYCSGTSHTRKLLSIS